MKFEQHKFRVLDSWRGISACFVALLHFRYEFFSHLHLSGLINRSFLFVDFFFVLSGFVIFANYERKLKEGYGFWPFMILRFGRVYPLHFCILMGFIAVELAQMFIPQLQNLAVQKPFGGAENSIADLPLQFLLLHGTGLSHKLTFNVPSWTISAEFYTYAIFALLIIIFRQRINIAVPLVALIAGAITFHHGTLIAHYGYGFIRCIYSFALGAFLWQLFEPREDRLRSILTGNKKLANVLEITLFIAVFVVISYVGSYGTVFVPLLFVLTIGVFAFQAGIVSRLLLTAPYVIIGALSYSIYMLHNPIASKVMGVVSRLLFKFYPGHQTVMENRTVWGDNLWTGDLIVVLYMAIVIVMSFATYWLIEVPGRNFFRRVVARRKAKATPPMPVV